MACWHRSSLVLLGMGYGSWRSPLAGFLHSMPLPASPCAQPLSVILDTPQVSSRSCRQRHQFKTIPDAGSHRAKFALHCPTPYSQGSHTCSTNVQCSWNLFGHMPLGAESMWQNSMHGTVIAVLRRISSASWEVMHLSGQLTNNAWSTLDNF